MSAEPAAAMDAEFPNLRADVVAAYRNAPEHTNVEIIDGELLPPPRSASSCASAVTQLVVELGPPFTRAQGGPGGWVLLLRTELQLAPGADHIAPTVAGWRRARMPVIPDAATIALAPDWVCEVLSGSDSGAVRSRVTRVYRSAGVAHCWLVDPRIHLLEVYRLEGGRYTLVDTWEGDAKVRAEPFDAIELDLSLLWAR